MLRRSAIVLVLLSGVFASGCDPDRSTATGVLRGTITAGGQPVPNVRLVAVGNDGKEYTGVSDTTGAYRIDAPPVGQLKITLTSATPPAPKAPGAAVPAGPKYAPVGAPAGQKEVLVEYTGGDQVYDVALGSDPSKAK